MQSPWLTFCRLTLHQIYTHGVRGFFIVLLATVFSGFVIISEYAFHIRLITREVSFVPSFSSLMIITELGPVIACLLMVSFSGAAIAAETAMIRLTDQWDAFRVERIPVGRFFVLPRVLGCMIICVGLTLFNMGGEIFAAVIVSPFKLGLTSQMFYKNLFNLVGPLDLTQGLIKAALFGLSYPCIAIFYGLKANRTASSIGMMATQAVVIASLTIIVEDFVISFLFSLFS